MNITVLLLILVTASVANALQCYECAFYDDGIEMEDFPYASDKDCKTKGKNLVTCPTWEEDYPNPTLQTKSKLPAPFSKNISTTDIKDEYKISCVKSVGEINGKHWVSRFCEFHYKMEADDCSNLENETPVGVQKYTYCYCSDNKCNSASYLQVPQVIIAVFVFWNVLGRLDIE